MDEKIKQAYVAGVERVAAWADLLDAINVFPVADGDTGRNLSISLSPLRGVGTDSEKILRQLLLAARGNSGNIATQFFSAFVAAASVHDLAEAARDGNVRAWKAITDPRPGTMLSIFDALEDMLWRDDFSTSPKGAEAIIHRLEQTVRDTRDMLPKLTEAGVVDSGALGLYIFFEGFFQTLAGVEDRYRPVTDVFSGSLSIAGSFTPEVENGYCVDFVVRADSGAQAKITSLAAEHESVVIIPQGDLYKIHLHTDDKDKVKATMGALGSVVNWESDHLASQMEAFRQARTESKLHIMTDAAGSLTRDDAKKHGFTLLNSYLNVGEKSLPETYFHPNELYGAMRQGVKVSTSQSSTFERHQFYTAALARFEKVLYLCVGSAFTGNYQIATDWKAKNDPDNRLTVIDTGAASGRLAVIVLSTQRCLDETGDMDKAIAFAKKAVEACEEYVFLEKLEYLAAGGRLSKTSAFFGDMLKMKPVISPQPEGAKKVGVVRHRKDQIKMALEKMAATLNADAEALIMLEHSDNIDEVRAFGGEVSSIYPKAEVIVQPLSLTSGAHMGPGTWGVAFLDRKKIG